MKNIIAVIALLAAAIPALAEPTTGQLDRETEYRMWAADQMIDRLASKLGKNDHPTLKSIREAAVSGDEVKWAAAVDMVRKLETDTKPQPNVLKRK